MATTYIERGDRVVAADAASGSESLAARYRRLRDRLGRVVPSNYDISDRCNLTCEGCLFFAGSDRLAHPDTGSANQWEAFFASQAARGVNFAYIAGAEPALELDRIRCARRYISRGVVFTNGTRFIPRDIDYRLHISVWGAPEENARARGADNLGKALRLYAGDPRAVFVYTISRANITDIHRTAALLASSGATLTFSYWSPTTDYTRFMAGDVGPNAYLRADSADTSLFLTPEDHARARVELERVVADFPETVRYSLQYDRWVTGPIPHRIDAATGIAIDCGNRITPDHLHFGVDLRRSEGKCCSPNIDCSGCRAYAQGYATYLTRFAQVRHDPAAMAAWLATWELWMELFLTGDRSA